MENLGIDGKLLLSQLVNFGIFFFLFARFVAKPFMSFLKKQQKEEEERLALLEKAKNMEATVAEKEIALRKKIAAEADEALKAAKLDAQAVKEDLVKKAHAEAEQIIEKARKQVEEERATMQKEVKNSVAELSTLMVQNVLKEFLSEKEQKQVTDRVLKNLNKNLPRYES